MQTQAPRGPRNPQKRTVEPRAASSPANVVRSTSQPQLRPDSAAANCSSTWGYVQKVSRPTVRCHEMSQINPTMMHADAVSTA